MEAHNQRKLIAWTFILIAAFFGLKFLSNVNLAENLGEYFEASYYNQFGPLAISIELLFAGIDLFAKRQRVNFTLALFGFNCSARSII